MEARLGDREGVTDWSILQETFFTEELWKSMKNDFNAPIETKDLSSTRDL